MRTVKRLSVTTVKWLLLACFVVIITVAGWHSCFLVFYVKIYLKEGEVWRKVFSNKIIVTLVTQGLRLTVFFRLPSCLVSSLYCNASFAEKWSHYKNTLLDSKRRTGARKTKRLHHSKT